MSYIEIGKIQNTHGIKGELKIESYSDFTELRYAVGNIIYIDFEGKLVPVKINSYRIHKNKVLVTLDGYGNINLVEKFKNHIVYMKDEDRQELDDGEFYIDELIDMEVVDEDHNKVGVVIDVEPTNGAQNNLRIEKEDGKTFLLPYVDAFIIEIDEEKNQIVANMVEGLF